MNIRQQFFEAKCARRHRRASTFPDWAKVKTVLVLYESEWQERNADIRALLKDLRGQHKQVVSWGFCRKNPILSPIMPDSRILGTKHINILHAPKQEVLAELSRCHFDVLLDLTVTPQLPLQYIALYADADFKIGARDQHNLYDMIIPMAADATQEEVFRQAMHYLQMIKSAD